MKKRKSSYVTLFFYVKDFSFFFYFLFLSFFFLSLLRSMISNNSAQKRPYASIAADNQTRKEEEKLYDSQL